MPQLLDVRLPQKNFPGTFLLVRGCIRMKVLNIDTRRWNEYLTLRHIDMLLLRLSAERKPLSSLWSQDPDARGFPPGRSTECRLRFLIGEGRYSPAALNAGIKSSSFRPLVKCRL
jgi:hypothetical protein